MKAERNRTALWRFALQRLLRHKRTLALALFWSVVFVLTPMQLPVITGAVIDNLRGKEVRLYGFKLGAEKAERQRNLGFAGGVLVGLAAVRGLSAYLRQRATNRLARRFTFDTRHALIERVTLMPLETHFKIGAGELLHRMVVDTGALRTFVNEVVVQTATNAFRVVFAVMLLFLHEAVLAAVVCSIIPLQWFCNILLQRKARAARREARKTQTRLTTLLKEQLDGTETIQSTGACALALRRTRRKVVRLEREQRIQANCSATKSAVIWFMTSLGLALTWSVGGLRVLQGHLSVGELVAFAGLVTFAFVPFRRVAATIDTSRKTLTSLEHVEELLNQPISPMERAGARPLVVQEGRIELRHVSFSYGAEPVLEKAHIAFEPGQITAIAGSSGAGKSSLLRLLNRLFDPLDGAVFIDGTDVREFTLASLRSAVALVPQRPMVFSGTLAANLRLARPEATDEELMAACEAAGLLGFVQRLEDGLQTRIGRRRAQLSGGEAQRLAIARALLMRSRILLLDEPTSALDARCQATIMDTLARLKAQMTIVVAGHRFEVLNQADRLVLLQDGRMVEPDPSVPLLPAINLYRANGDEKPAAAFPFPQRNASNDDE